MRIALLSDGFNINKKNFGNLLNFLSARGVVLHAPKNHPLSVSAYGNYIGAEAVLASARTSLQGLSDDELFAQHSCGINLFDVCRAEALSYLLTLCSELSQPLPEQKKALFAWMLDISRDHLLNNMAAAKVWIEFWDKYTKDTISPDYTIIFSGSLIYARSLLEVMKYRKGRVFVLESFFTGNHFYCEERFEPIANRSDIRFVCVQQSLKLPEDRYKFELERDIALAAAHNIQNKNVQQPPPSEEQLFPTRDKIALILGQVFNDFSLIEYKMHGLNSINFYVRLIDIILATTDMNIVFKAHPWEWKKHNLKSSVTADYLRKRYTKNNRIRIIEDWNIYNLFEQVDCVLTINSQSGIEAALYGFRPLQAGDAFWGGRGFSFDTNINDDRAWAHFLHNPDIWRININEYDSLSAFLIQSLRMWLVPEKGDARWRLLQIFHELPANPIVVHSSSKPVLPEQISWKLFYKRFRKLLKNPKAFIRDSRFAFLRKLAGRGQM